MAGSCSAWLALVPALVAAPPAKGRSDPPVLERHEYVQIQMGVSFKMVLYAPDAKTANLAAQAAFGCVRQLNDVLSDYDEKSELSRLSDSAGSGRAVVVSDDLWRVLVRSREV